MLYLVGVWLFLGSEQLLGNNWKLKLRQTIQPLIWFCSCYCLIKLVSVMSIFFCRSLLSAVKIKTMCVSTCSGLRPVKQNIPIWSITCCQLWVEPSFFRPATSCSLILMMRLAIPWTSSSLRWTTAGQERSRHTFWDTSEPVWWIWKMKTWTFNKNPNDKFGSGNANVYMCK